MRSKKKIIKKKIIEKTKTFVLKRGTRFLLIFLIIIASFLSGILFNKITILSSSKRAEDLKIAKSTKQSEDLSRLQDKVLKKNYTFKIKWGDLGRKMADDGVINKTKFAQAITGTDKLPKELDKYFEDGQNKIEVNSQNAQFWVDMLWGLGLANKNKILESGDMMQDGDASMFASTGGWTLGPDDPMSVYSMHSYINLTDKQQQMVEKIAKSIYRPCCGNSTAFPDCNHGMAMLGLIELMVSQGATEEEIYKAALAFNTYWFPDTYLNTAYYFDKKGEDYSKISPKEILSEKFSSAMGAQAIAQDSEGVQWPALQGNGGSCGA